jgi:hypothetical protein
MSKDEIKEMIKQVYKEEQDYQQLFKTMLDRTGKDINSMSDEQKKKFFSAVDKAYKAKTEGKLIDSKKNELNESFGEIFGEPGIILLAAYVIPYFIKLIISAIDTFVSGDEYAKAVESMFNKLKDDKQFIDSIAKFIANDPNLSTQVIAKIQKLPIVQKYAREEEDERTKNWDKNPNAKNYKKTFAGSGVIAYEFAKTFWAAWNDTSIKNSAMIYIKNKLK